MERKRSIGVTIFSIVLALFGIRGIYMLIFGIIIGGGTVAINMFFLPEIVYALCCAAANGIYKLNSSGRKLTLILSATLVIYNGYKVVFCVNRALEFYNKSCWRDTRLALLELIFFLCTIYFFTRPKVKAQFNQ